MRHCTNVLAAIVTLADPASTAKPTGKWLVAALGCWAVYRLATPIASECIRGHRLCLYVGNLRGNSLVNH